MTVGQTGNIVIVSKQTYRGLSFTNVPGFEFLIKILDRTTRKKSDFLVHTDEIIQESGDFDGYYPTKEIRYKQ